MSKRRQWVIGSSIFALMVLVGLLFGFLAAVAAALLIAIPASLLGWVPGSFGWGRFGRRSAGSRERDGSRSGESEGELGEDRQVSVKLDPIQTTDAERQ